MDKSTKLYAKAIKFYNDGYIDKSLEFCEKSISENLKNSSAINLKGLLYYLKGELDNAQALWNMNYQINEDMVSKKYLEDSKNDKEKNKLYKEAINYIKEIKIKEALYKLESCLESDFNFINVNNSIAFCYIKLGEYNKAEIFIEKVLNIDKNNKTALSLKKELIDFGIIKNKSYNRYFVPIIILSLIFIISSAFIKISKKTKDYSKNIESINNNSINKIQNNMGIKNDLKYESENKKEEIKENSYKIFPKEDINKALENKDYEKLYNIVSNLKNDNTSYENTRLIAKAEEILKNNGVLYFYNKGREYLSLKDYTKAIENLNKAYIYGSGSYLYPHINYMIGLTYKEMGNIENAIKYYKEYDSKYPNGDYEETVLYELILIYKDIDYEVSKNYARKLIKLYPKSIYNNSIVKEILKNN
jgi:tetratricopeptide (TPR) repeat protein